MADHLSQELGRSSLKCSVQTKYGIVNGRRTENGCAVFLELPFALPPKRFEDPTPLPEDFRYDPDYEFIHESKYATQPMIDGQAAGRPPQDKLGLGKPTENPLFLNIVAPPSFKQPFHSKKPVRIYIHGGFLQFGSPHGLSGQAQYVSAERDEVWVNIGYRVSVFGFLANGKDPYIPGNFGFKDVWLGLLWVQQNIHSFGGDPENIILTGLSAGAHVCHQVLHFASRLPKGSKAPFQGIILQSNAIICDSRTPSDLHAQYSTLCSAISLDPTSPSTFATLQDPIKTPWELLTAFCDSLPIDKFGPYTTFRGCTDGDGPGTWMPAGTMAYQDSPSFAKNLKDKGVKFLIVGEMMEEWYLYSIAHPLYQREGVKGGYEESIRLNMTRYYPEAVVDGFMQYFKKTDKLRNGMTKNEATRVFGDMLSDAQVYVPVRLLHRDLAKDGFPVMRYRMCWTPAGRRNGGYVTHGGDRSIWAFRLDGSLSTPEEVNTAKRWLDAVDKWIASARTNAEPQATRTIDDAPILTLREDASIGWDKDPRWDELMDLARHVLPHEKEKVLMKEAVKEALGGGGAKL